MLLQALSLDSRLEEKNVNKALYVSLVISSCEYNDFACLVLPLVSWKPPPSPRKASP